ncbi:MAG: hypothetical protein QF662_03545, partial [Phycisphaerae bacterium]|nr:hypothetical protein [Phycisphaerae bacterium]
MAAQTADTDDELETLKGILTRPETPPSSRIDIAKLLLNKATPQANKILADALDLSANPDIPVAVLSAIAQHRRPDPVFIEKVFPMLGSESPK